MRILFERRTSVPRFSAAWLWGWPAQDRPDALASDVERLAVESRSLASMGFDSAARVQKIEFRPGVTDCFLSLRSAVMEHWQQAEAQGRSGAQFIRGRDDFQQNGGCAQ